MVAGVAMCARRCVGRLGAVVCGALFLLYGAAAAADASGLTVDQSQAFRAWMVRVVDLQIQRPPTPRWLQRDCAGLVRFAVAEALRPHDAGWLRANGMAGGRLPPELGLSAAQGALRHAWVRADGSRGAYVDALGLIQRNSRLVGREINQAEPGDLLFYDQGDAQHLMVWMGGYVAYHTGSVTPTDNGMRKVSINQLRQWKDTRWQPNYDNPNFIGVFRLAFLAR